MSENYELTAISNDVQIGKNGLRIKSDGDRLIVRNNDDTDFGFVQTAVGEQSYHTIPKSQYDAMRDVLIYRVYTELDYNDTSPINIGIPVKANSTIFKIIVNVDTAFDAVNSTLQIGVGTDDDALQSIDSTNLQQVGTYVSYEYHQTSNEEQQIYATLNDDNATTGHCSVVILYYET